MTWLTNDPMDASVYTLLFLPSLSQSLTLTQYSIQFLKKNNTFKQVFLHYF